MKLFFSLALLVLYLNSSAQGMDSRVKKAKVAYSGEMTSNPDSTEFVKDSFQKDQIEGKFTEDKDQRIDMLLQDYIDNKKITGFRIQLFSGNSRWEAVKVKSDFLQKYKEEIPPHLVYQSPNFKIRVGDFRNRLEAQKNLELLKIDYPTAFIVKDDIEVPIED